MQVGCGESPVTGTDLGADPALTAAGSARGSTRTILRGGTCPSGSVLGRRSSTASGVGQRPAPAADPYQLQGPGGRGQRHRLAGERGLHTMRAHQHAAGASKKGLQHANRTTTLSGGPASPSSSARTRRIRRRARRHTAPPGLVPGERRPCRGPAGGGRHLPHRTVGACAPHIRTVLDTPATSSPRPMRARTPTRPRWVSGQPQVPSLDGVGLDRSRRVGERAPAGTLIPSRPATTCTGNARTAQSGSSRWTDGSGRGPGETPFTRH